MAANDVERAALGWANLGGYACAKPLTHSEQKSIFDRAHQLGVRMHDTAIDYGRGFAEEGLGLAWTAGQIPRDELRIQSKVLRRIITPESGQQYREAGLWSCPEPYASRITTWDWSYSGVLHQAAESRERLRIDYHNGLALHDPAEAIREAGFRLVDLDAGALAALRDLKQQGRLREIGVGSKEIDVVLDLLRLYPRPFDYFMIMNYNLLDHHRCLDKLIPACQDHGVRLFLAGPYASGILASSTSEMNPFLYYKKADRDVVRKTELLVQLAREHGMNSLRPAAVQFVAANSTFSRIIFGGRTPTEIEENIGNLSSPIPAAFWQRLRETTLDGKPLIHPKAPLPEH